MSTLILTYVPFFFLFTDVDECVTPANNCKYQCKNLIGSFICICPEGFAPASTPNDCVDVDECANDPNLCKHGTCVNLLGNYRCDCFDGYKSSVDNKHCLGWSIFNDSDLFLFSVWKMKLKK